MVETPPGGWILVSGSRDWPEDELYVVTATMIEHHSAHPDSGILTGGAVGVDQYAEKEAKRLGWPTDKMLPNYDKYDARTAPKMRNIELLERNPFLLLAFHWGRSPGTGHTIRHAYKRGIPFIRISRESMAAEHQLVLSEIDASE